eukprot:PhM_4_TR5475/c0_g1_i1/m.17982
MDRLRTELESTELVDKNNSVALGKITFHVQDSNHDPVSYPLLHQRTVVGRGEGADVKLIVASVSKEHMALYCLKNGAIHAEDLRSSNGTFLVSPAGAAGDEGVRMVPGTKYPIVDGQRIKFGKGIAVGVVHLDSPRAVAAAEDDDPDATLPVPDPSAVFGGTIPSDSLALDDEAPPVPSRRVPSTAAVATTSEASEAPPIPVVRAASEDDGEETAQQQKQRADDEDVDPPSPISIGRRKSSAASKTEGFVDTKDKDKQSGDDVEEDGDHSPPPPVRRRSSAASATAATTAAPVTRSASSTATAAESKPKDAVVAHAPEAAEQPKDEDAEEKEAKPALPTRSPRAKTAARAPIVDDDDDDDDVDNSDSEEEEEEKAPVPRRSLRLREAEAAVRRRREEEEEAKQKAAKPATRKKSADTASAAKRRKVVVTSPKKDEDEDDETPMWYYKSDLRKRNDRSEAWQPYTKQESVKLEKGYQAYQKRRDKNIATLNGTYSVDYNGMLQFRTIDSSRQRPMKRGDDDDEDE